LPILKADDTLPKVTQVVDKNFSENDLNEGPAQRTFDENEEVGGHDLSDEDVLPQASELKQTVSEDKPVHEVTEEQEEVKEEEKKLSRKRREARKSRGFCDGGGVFCALYRAIQGEPINSQLIAERREETGQTQQRYEGPPTPCPAKVEYVTPVFAKNFQGSWRYVVQIPYEGYFTQTVEVTRCLQTKCHYLGEFQE
jgi:hypothetical protein